MVRRWVGSIVVVVVLAGLFLAAARMFVPSPASAQVAGRPAVTGLRVASHDGITRFVMDLTAPIAFTVSSDASGVLVYVDMPELEWRTDLHGLTRAVGVLKTFRLAPSQPGTARLVLESGTAAIVQKNFLLPPGANGQYRLVIDLVPGAAMPPPLPAATPTAESGLNPIAPTLAPVLASIPNGPPPPKPTSAVVMPGDDVASRPGAAQTISLPLPPPLDPAPGKEALPERRQSHGGKPIVVLDPGHGGQDPGALSLTGAYEKNIVLALAREVKAQLDKDGKVRAVLTRDHDFFIPLRERVAIARKAHADLFMSLHADTVADPQIRGLSVYTLSQHASDDEAQALADKENKVDIVGGIDFSNESPEVTNILIDLVQRETMNLSAVFATQVIGEVQRETHMLLENTHRFAGFAVLKAPDIPSVLVENGYLSNEQDEQMLRRPEYRTKLASALARAIERYFAQTQKAKRS